MLLRRYHNGPSDAPSDTAPEGSDGKSDTTASAPSESKPAGRTRTRKSSKSEG